MRPARRALACLALLALSASLAGCLQGSLVGKPVPPFEVVTSEGVRVNESTYLGRFLVLDLMATWCAPCELEVAHLREVQRLHGDEVVILSVGSDPTETTTDLARFAQETGATWPHALDRDGTVGRAMGVRTIPKLVVVDPHGVVVLEREGEVYPAAISRVVDPATAPPEGRLPLAGPVLLALVLGVLAPLNPYRRFHRAGGGRLAMPLALLAAGGLVLVAWRAAGFVSGRATYGSLALGLVTLGAAAWWWRARRRQAREAPAPNAALEAGDRLYELGPHLAFVVVLGLTGAGAWGFFAPAAGFLLGAALGEAARGRLPAGQREAAGVAGLVLAGLGLLAFGARILAAAWG